MFVSYNGKVVSTSNIAEIFCAKYISEDYVIVRYHNLDIEFVKGVEALNLIHATCPNVLEGKRGKYKRNAWMIHNLIGHPVMQILCWLGLHTLGIKVHDLTIPECDAEASS